MCCELSGTIRCLAFLLEPSRDSRCFELNCYCSHIKLADVELVWSLPSNSTGLMVASSFTGTWKSQGFDGAAGKGKEERRSPRWWHHWALTEYNVLSQSVSEIFQWRSGNCWQCWREKSREIISFILWGPWMSAPNFMVIHPLDVEIFQSGSPITREILTMNNKSIVWIIFSHSTLTSCYKTAALTTIASVLQCD